MRETDGPDDAEGLSPYACEHYCQGRCLYGDSPARPEESACRRLRELTREWDDFLDRVEAFGLEEDLAKRLWERRRHAALQRCPGNPQGLVSPDGVACAHFHAGLCLPALPVCASRCGRYRRRPWPEPMNHASGEDR